MAISAPESIVKLVKKFKDNEHIYTSSDFDEENTKIEFINPFFEALGWDVHNKKEKAPQYKEVVFEDTVKINGKVKAPDYSFRLGGQKIFFVEAKKPSVKLDKDKHPAFQARRYAWNAKLPLSILTDFEEFAVYETNSKPHKKQNASVDRIKYYKYTDYVEKWEEIYNVFSKEAVEKGKFDKYVSGHECTKKGTSTVDKEFLKEIEDWRLKLARNIALRNKKLTIDELNCAVQLIINRILFLRIAEDRGIEKYGQLKNLLKHAKHQKDKYSVYKEFVKLCEHSDAKYNSGLFHFTEEKDMGLEVDQLTPNLSIDDGVFKEIFNNLYYPDCPYEFSILPTETLGNVYEQFLGKIIRLTESHQAKVEDKPEVKKAGGVFYTPQYIVEYIVENTVGRLLKGKTPNQVSKLRFLDLACGSGSFLLGAYQYLINWHLDYYSNLKKPPKDVIFTPRDGIPRLTIQEKKRILLNNIYGVDIDSQAVEVTKLSLLLKVLEDQNKDEIELQQKLFQERVLPDLDENIKCGNTLVNSEMLQDASYSMEDKFELNPFNWQKEFSEIFKNGGFDAVIGNPPYVKENTNKEAFNAVKNLECYKGKMDLWYLFGAKALDIVKKGGLVSFIATNNWITNSGASKFRNKINDEAKFVLYRDFGNYKVFDRASIQTMIYVMKKDSSFDKYTFDYSKLLESNLDKEKVVDFLNSGENINFNSFKAVFNRVINKDNYFKFIEEEKANLLYKIQFNGNEHFNSKEISQGIISPQDDLNNKNAEKLNFRYLVGTGIFVISTEEKENLNLNDEEYSLIKPYFTTNELFRFYSDSNNKYWIIYTKSDINNKINKYPNIKKHLDKFKSVITSDNKPYGLHRARKEEIFTKEKIIVTRKCQIPTFSYADFNAYVSQTFMVINSDRFDLKYLTGILNSKLIQFWLKFNGKMQGNNYQLDKEPLLNIPLCIDEAMLNEVINLVESILKLNEGLQLCNSKNEKRIYEDDLELKEVELNKLVYEIYGLNRKEIEIIESNI